MYRNLQKQKLNRIQQLIENNKGRGKFRSETTDNETTIYLYDVIVDDDYWGGVSALTFAKTLTGINTDKINLRLNSPGGSVFASIAMAQAMNEHKAEITVHVDGYAASAATQLLMAADKSVISMGGMVMIHRAWTFSMGNAEDFAKEAALLNKIDGQIVDSYAAKTGIPTDELMQMLSDETWLTETEAVEKGFVDAIAESKTDKGNKNLIKWDLSAYSKPPDTTDQEETPPDGEDSAEPQENGSEDIGAVSVSDTREKLRLHLRITTNRQ